MKKALYVVLSGIGSGLAGAAMFFPQYAALLILMSLLICLVLAFTPV